MSKPRSIPFKAETRQLLDILIHSLYANREVFLRELISNASDALTRMNFEMLTNREVLDAGAALEIRILADKEKKTLTIRDNGIGMNENEMRDNLGTIAHSGAKEFLQAAAQKDSQTQNSDIIGQFGVGFYAAFMAADKIRVLSRSYRPDDTAWEWLSSGSDTYTVQPAERTRRGSDVILHLKEDALEFLEEPRLREIIRRHSDFVPFPIYIGEESQEQVNQQTAVWRTSARDLNEEKASEFYRQFTLDFEKPLTYGLVNVDAPVQLYALLYIPSTAERTMFSLRREEGLKLYARKILIREYDRELLPEYLRFVQGVVDSEDIPLNVSREVMQNTRLITQIRKVLTSRVHEMIKSLTADKPDVYAKFWKEFGRFIKEGVASDREAVDSLAPFLRFPSLQQPQGLVSLDEYISGLPAGEKTIYYLLGEDALTASRSPHLDPFRKNGIDVLLYTDPIDPFAALTLTKYKEYSFANAAVGAPLEEEKKPESSESAPPPLSDELEGTFLAKVKDVLGDKVNQVSRSKRLVDSPARVIQTQGDLNPELQKVYRLLNREAEQVSLTLEMNLEHPIVRQLLDLQEGDERFALAIEQLFDNALLVEGLHPDPAAMVERMQTLLKSALR